MTAKIIDGKQLAENIRLQVRKEILDQNLHPGLAIILVGNDPASHLYVNLKEKACNEVGIIFNKYFLEADATQEQLNEVIDFLNEDESIHAILIQLPLPSHLDENAAVARISPNKEVDGFGPENMKKFMNDQGDIIPGLPNGIYELIKSTSESLEDKETVVVANSEVFAKPIIHMMELKAGNASYVSPNSPELTEKTLEADILIVAVGRPYFIKEDQVKDNAIIIDVGTNQTDDGYYGDVDPAVDDIVAYRSPVPGGVGPMTIAMLLKNTIDLYKAQGK